MVATVMVMVMTTTTSINDDDEDDDDNDDDDIEHDNAGCFEITRAGMMIENDKYN